MTKEKYPWLEYTSIITGTVASAGSIFAIVCDKRYMTKHSHLMIHELAAGRTGKFTHLKSYQKHLNDLHDVLVDIYLEKCKKPRDEIESLLAKETWWNAEESLEHGFIDKIV
jgi:ATP-dependent Clp protease, protease subunit